MDAAVLRAVGVGPRSNHDISREEPRDGGLVDVGSLYAGRGETWVLRPAASIVASAAGSLRTLAALRERRR